MPKNDRHTSETIKRLPWSINMILLPLLSPALKKANPLVPEKKGVLQAALWFI